MKYIKKIFIKLKMAIAGYQELKNKDLDICDEIFEEVCVFKRFGRVKIFAFKADGTVNKITEIDICDAFISRNLVLTKSGPKGANIRCLIYNFDNGSNALYREVTLNVIKLEGMLPGDLDDSKIGFGKIKYVGTRTSGNKVFYDKNLNPIFEDDILAFQYYRSIKRENYLAVVLDVKKKYHIINDMGQVSNFTYDYVKPMTDREMLPIVCYFRENEGNKESKMLYHLYTSEYIEDTYRDLSDYRICVDESTNKTYFIAKDKDTRLYAIVSDKGRLLTEFEYDRVSDVTSNMFFAKEETGIHLINLDGLKRSAKPYKRVYEPFVERTYGCFKMNLAVVSSWQRNYFLDINGNKYEIFEEYEYNDEPFFN